MDTFYVELEIRRKTDKIGGEKKSKNPTPKLRWDGKNGEREREREGWEREIGYPSILVGIDEHKLVPVMGTSNESTSGVHHWHSQSHTPTLVFWTMQVFFFFKSSNPTKLLTPQTFLVSEEDPHLHWWTTSQPPHRSKRHERIQNDSFFF